MKILLLCHEFSDFGGGAGNAARAIASELVREGHSVHAITSNFNGRLPRREVSDGIAIHRVPGWRRNALENRILPTFASFVLAGTRCGHRLCREESFDVIHAFFTLPAGLVGRRLSVAHGIPLVVSLRGSDVPYYVPSRQPSRLVKMVTRRVWQKADRVVALSEGLLSIARKTAPLGGAVVIHNGVATHTFTASSRDDACDDRLRIVCACRLVRHKGVHFLLRAFRALQGRVPATLRIVGDGPERARLEFLACELGIEDNVEFVGYVPHGRLAEEYHRADLFVLPTLTESFGQVITEAMACGLPVIASRVGGIPEIVQDGVQGWLVPAADPGALADAITASAAEGVAALHRRGADNATYAASRFSWRRIAREYASVYSGVCGSVGGARE